MFLQSFRKSGGLPDRYRTSQTWHQDHRTGVHRSLGLKKKKRNKHTPKSTTNNHPQNNKKTTPQQNQKIPNQKTSDLTSIEVRLIDVHFQGPLEHWYLRTLLLSDARTDLLQQRREMKFSPLRLKEVLQLVKQTTVTKSLWFDTKTLSFG